MCIKDINIHSVAQVMPQGRDIGVLEVKNLSVGVCPGAPSTAGSSYFIIVKCLFFIFT